MQLRMLGRRSLSGSMTIVGDVAQATGEWAPSSWDEVLAHLPAHKGNRVTELTVNYRTPSEIMELAGRILAVAAPGMTRSGGGAHDGRACPGCSRSTRPGWPSAVARVARDESAVVSGESAAGGRVAIICPPSSVDPLSAALVELDVPFGTPAAGALDDLVSLIPVESVKGLEFDSVIVVDPAGIVAESAQGLAVAVRRPDQGHPPGGPRLLRRPAGAARRLSPDGLDGPDVPGLARRHAPASGGPARARRHAPGGGGGQRRRWSRSGLRPTVDGRSRRASAAPARPVGSGPWRSTKRSAGAWPSWCGNMATSDGSNPSS